MAEKSEQKQAKKPEYPDTPSGKALAEVGNVDGESVDPDNPKPVDAEAINAHGEAYQAAKRKHRWG
jgi:hypothetical protein